MGNKIIDFVQEFNINLEEKKSDNFSINYTSQGYTEGVSIPEMYVWDSENYNSEYFKQLSLSNMVNQLSAYLEVANDMLTVEVDEFLNNVINDFAGVKIEIKRLETTVWEFKLLYGYEESRELDDKMDAIKEDFEYIFDGCKLNCFW